MLVLSPFWFDAWKPRPDFFRRKFAFRSFRAPGITSRIAVWPGQDDGFYASTFERSAQSYALDAESAAGVAGVSRATGAALAPFLAGILFARPALINAPFFIAGTLKIIYDLLFYRSFLAIKPPEETRYRG